MAECILILHLAFILYVVIGFVAGVVTNHAGFRLWHAGILGGITLLMVLGLPCPLTVLEEMFSDRDYGGSFLAYWLRRVIYLEDFNQQKVFLIDLAFAALVASSFLWRPLKKK